MSDRIHNIDFGKSQGLATWYHREYRKKLAHVAQVLPKEDCRKLYFINGARVAGRWKKSDGNLALFELFEQTGITSYDRPESLVEVLRDIERADLCQELELFIDEHKDAILVAQSIQVTVADRPYVRTPPSQHTATLQDDPYYSVFFPKDSLQTTPLASHGDIRPIYDCQTSGESSSDSKSSSTDSATSSLRSSSDEPEEVECPYENVTRDTCTILRVTSSDPKPLVEQNLRLLAKPVQQLIKRGQEHSLWSPDILHATSNSRFRLKISLVDLKGARISGYLYMLSGSRLMENVLLQAELSVKLPHHSKKKMRQKRSEPSSKYIYRSCVLMDMPPASNRHEQRKPSLVAQFPHIMSHSNVLKEDIVVGPFLELTLVIKEY